MTLRLLALLFAGCAASQSEAPEPAKTHTYRTCAPLDSP